MEGFTLNDSSGRSQHSLVLTWCCQVEGRSFLLHARSIQRKHVGVEVSLFLSIQPHLCLFIFLFLHLSLSLSLSLSLYVSLNGL